MSFFIKRSIPKLAWLSSLLYPLVSASAVPDALKIEQRPAAEDDRPLLFWSEDSFEGVSYPVHFVRYDLRAQDYELVAIAEVAPGDDNKALTAKPLVLFEEAGLLAAINANPFLEGGWLKKLLSSAGRPVTLYGSAIVEGHPLKGTSDPYAGSLWVEPTGEVRIDTLEPGALLDLPSVQNAVSGFHQLIADSTIMDWGGHEGPDAQRIARTAAGVSADGRWLYLVVAEGRQSLSDNEGYTERAMARLMYELGCSEALVLDGGGSCVLMVREQGEAKILNQWTGRPVPILLGIKETAPESALEEAPR